MGTSKEAVLEWDTKCTNLIRNIMYDTNSIHYMNMVSEELKWAIKEKECFNIGTGKFKKNDIHKDELHQKI